MKNQNTRDMFESEEIREVEDSILEEVDQYLTKWRGKA